MNVTYPLSVKVSLWLLLNLLLLAAAGVGFFVVQGGLGWSALVAGVTGERAQAKATALARELATDSRPAAAVLKDLSVRHSVDLLIVRANDTIAASTDLPLPPRVRARVEHALSLPPGFTFGRGRGPRLSSESNPPDASHRSRSPGDRSQADPAAPAPRVDENPRRAPAGEFRVERVDLSRDRDRNRFVVRTQETGDYWIGLRILFFPQERGRPAPVMLLARTESFWGLLRFLELEAWVLGGTVVLAFSIVFWLPLVGGITRSLKQLTAATERIAEGRFDTRVPAKRRDEIGKLGESVNRMAARLDTHMTGQKRFLADVAHELCSPLARLQMATGILDERAPENLRSLVADVRDEAQQMSTLVNELLAFTKAGLRPRDVALSPVELEPLAREVLEHEDASGRVTLEIPAGLAARGEPELLRRALANLVRNALRYAGDAGPIRVSAARDHAHVLFAVEDEGPGVPPEALDRLGEPFFRPEAARTRETGGVGLGLAIVRSSVSALGGQLRFTNRSPKGFRAEIRLPLA